MSSAVENNSKSVAILMAAYNGEKFIAEQLESLASQSHSSWRLIVSDDGSTDTTLEILQRYQLRWGSDKIKIISGPQNGFALNFLSMACDPEARADYYAFCDQDDVWLPEKLKVAIDYFEGESDSQIPRFYCGRTIYATDDLKPYEFSPEFVYPPSFKNALVQNIAGGNTMVFNQAAKTLLEKTGAVPTPWHDWWLYQIVTGAGGGVYYDPHPQVIYRQHTNAVVGGSTSLWTRINRLKRARAGEFCAWSEQNIACLRICYDSLSDSARETFELFVAMRSARFMDRLRLFKRCGLYRQSWLGSKTLLIEALLKKI